MRRSSSGRARRTHSNAVPDGLSESAASLVVRGTHDRVSRLSEGTLVQGSVRARLLGLPLLRLEATVVLVPAGLKGSSRAPNAPQGILTGSLVPPSGTSPTGDGLAEAVRRINEGAQILAEFRRNGS